MAGAPATPGNSFFNYRQNAHNATLCTTSGACLLRLKDKYPLGDKISVPEPYKALYQFPEAYQISPQSLDGLIKLAKCYSPSTDPADFDAHTLAMMREFAKQFYVDGHPDWYAFTVDGKNYSMKLDEVFGIVASALSDPEPDGKPVDADQHWQAYADHLRTSDVTSYCATRMRNFLVQSLTAIDYPGVNVFYDVSEFIRDEISRVLPALIIQRLLGTGQYQAYANFMTTWIKEGWHGICGKKPDIKKALYTGLAAAIRSSIQQLGFDPTSKDSQVQDTLSQVDSELKEEILDAYIDAMDVMAAKHVGGLYYVHLLYESHPAHPVSQQALLELKSITSPEDLKIIDSKAKDIKDKLDLLNSLTHLEKRIRTTVPAIQETISRFNTTMEAIGRNEPLSSDIAKQLETDQATLQAFIEGSSKGRFTNVENFFARLTAEPILENKLQMIREIATESLEVTDAFIEQHAVRDDEGITHITPYLLNRIFLHALSIDRTKWTDGFLSALKHCIAFVESDFAGAPLGHLLKRDSYSPLLIQKLKALVAMPPHTAQEMAEVTTLSLSLANIIAPCNSEFIKLLQFIEQVAPGATNSIRNNRQFLAAIFEIPRRFIYLIQQPAFAKWIPDIKSALTNSDLGRGFLQTLSMQMLNASERNWIAKALLEIHFDITSLYQMTISQITHPSKLAWILNEAKRYGIFLDVREAMAEQINHLSVTPANAVNAANAALALLMHFPEKKAALNPYINPECPVYQMYCLFTASDETQRTLSEDFVNTHLKDSSDLISCLRLIDTCSPNREMTSWLLSQELVISNVLKVLTEEHTNHIKILPLLGLIQGNRVTPSIISIVSNPLVIDIIKASFQFHIILNFLTGRRVEPEDLLGFVDAYIAKYPEINDWTVNEVAKKIGLLKGGPDRIFALLKEASNVNQLAADTLLTIRNMTRKHSGCQVKVVELLQMKLNIKDLRSLKTFLPHGIDSIHSLCELISTEHHADALLTSIFDKKSIFTAIINSHHQFGRLTAKLHVIKTKGWFSNECIDAVIKNLEKTFLHKRHIICSSATVFKPVNTRRFAETSDATP